MKICKCKHSSNLHTDHTAYWGACTICECPLFEILIPEWVYKSKGAPIIETVYLPRKING